MGKGSSVTPDSSDHCSALVAYAPVIRSDVVGVSAKALRLPVSTSPSRAPEDKGLTSLNVCVGASDCLPVLTELTQTDSPPASDGRLRDDEPGDRPTLSTVVQPYVESSSSRPSLCADEPVSDLDSGPGPRSKSTKSARRRRNGKKFIQL